MDATLSRNNIDRLLTAAEVAQRLRISKRTMFNWRKKGVLPTPIRIGPRLVRWPASAIDELIARGKS